jgi:hypothetical protein
MDGLQTAFNRSSSVLRERPGELEKFMADYDIARTCPYAKKQLIDGDVTQSVARPSGGGATAFFLSSRLHTRRALGRALPCRADSGSAAVVRSGVRAGGGGISAAAVANVTHSFISLLDLLEMEMTSVDEILPELKQLVREIR